MRKRLAGAAYALALAGLAAPATAEAQVWERLKKAARQQLDTALSTTTGGVTRRGSCPTNATPQCARPAALGERVDGAIGGNGRELYYRFAVDQPGVLQIALGPMPNQGQVQMWINDQQSKEIGRFHFEAGQPGTRLFQLAAPGTYYVRLYGLSSDAERFTLAVTNTPRTSSGTTPGNAAPGTSGCVLNNTFQCAEAAALGARATGVIGGNARELFYRVAVDRPGVFRVALSPMPNQGQVQMWVTDEEYKELERSVFEAGQPGSRLVRLAAPGTYYVRLYGLSSDAERFGLSVSDEQPAPRAAPASGPDAGAGATTYDLARDWSPTRNPMGPWTAGFRPAPGGAFTPFSQRATTDGGRLLHWAEEGRAPGPGGAPYPSAFKSTAAVAYNGTARYRPDEVALHPGPRGELAVYRFTAPAGGTYRVRGTFYGLDARYPTTSNAAVLLIAAAGGAPASLFDAPVRGFREPSAQAIDTMLVLAAGDALDFQVGYGSNGNYYGDTTGLEVQISAGPRRPGGRARR